MTVLVTRETVLLFLKTAGIASNRPTLTSVGGKDFNPELG
jgi:hypothetical protein